MGARGWIRLPVEFLLGGAHPSLARPGPRRLPSPLLPRRPLGCPSPIASANRPRTVRGSSGPTPVDPDPRSWEPRSHCGSTPCQAQTVESPGPQAPRDSVVRVGAGVGRWPSPRKCPPEPHGASAQGGWSVGGFPGAGEAVSPPLPSLQVRRTAPHEGGGGKGWQRGRGRSSLS